MNVALHPRVAPSDRIRVWLGVSGVTKPPRLTWLLDGQPARPSIIRALQSARPAGPRASGGVPAHTPRVFTGIYECPGLQPDTSHDLVVQVDGEPPESLTVRTLPDGLPSGMNEWFNVLLVSCFHRAEDRKGLVGTVVSRLPPAWKPHVTLLMGDQVYLDLPTLKNFPIGTAELAEKFERDYWANWALPPGFPQVLRLAPSVSLPDDHEFWNNYPHASPTIQNSYTKSGRQNWRRAAEMMYDAFQSACVTQAGVSQPGGYYRLEVPPVSIFLADSRWNRNETRKESFSSATRKHLKAWAKNVARRRWYGVFVTGQSLYDLAAGRVKGAVGEYTLPNYDDYPDVIQTLMTLPSQGCPLVCITGDVHWGRVAQARDSMTGRVAIHEIISSPASLVSTIGMDQWKRLRGVFSGWFGTPDPWPRHSEPEEPPAYLAREFHGAQLLAKRFPCVRLSGAGGEPVQKGNHVALLSFRRAGDGVDARLRYWPVHQDREQRSPVDVPLTKLRPLL